MKTFFVSLFLLLVVSSSIVSAFDTVVTKTRQLEAPKYTYNLYFFTCGKEIYKCGKGSIDPEYLCPTPSGAVPATGKITVKQCEALIEEARKADGGLLYGKAEVVDLCPNGKNVVSYTKYTTQGFGRFCKPKKACTCCHNGEIGGDPHLLTYDGTPYSYHGQCDLVMAQSEQFADGLGLRIYARTEIIDGAWSLISNAAVQIGDDIIEMTNTGDIYFNGHQISNLDNDLPQVMSGTHNITREVHYIGKDHIPKIDLNILLYEGEKNKIRMSLFKRLLAVHVGATEEDLSGMLGHRLYNGLMGRDGVTIMDGPNEMGQEWQVRDTEPMLFHEIKVPQYPQQCILPDATTNQRRLRTANNEQHRRRANEACAGIHDKRKMQFCIEDMLLTGDVHMADIYKHAQNYHN